MCALSCREIQPFEAPLSVPGYEFNGTVTTANGVPLDSVEVRLFYKTALVRETPIDTQGVVVTDPSRIVYIAVYTEHNQYIRQLFFGYRSPGLLPRFHWDEQDDSGHFVPSGKYLIRYVYNATIVKEVSHLAEGHRTAMSNNFGEFRIANDHFPIGELFDFYEDEGTYYGTFEVLSQVRLVLSRGTLQSSYLVGMEKNKITRGAFILE